MEDNRPCRGLFQTDVDPSSIWELGKTIGKGAFGFVHLAISTKDKTKQAAIKLISIEEQNEVETIRKEVKILKLCNHSNIVTFDNTYIQGETMWLVMEFCGGGAVSDLLRFRALKEPEIAVVLRESLLGLSHLHQQRVLHRDMKSANLLLTLQGTIKLADFGVSKILENKNNKTKTFVGTPHWMAPEIVQGKEYDERCDLWSIGIVGIELAEQNPPKHQINMHGVLAAISKAPAPTLTNQSEWSTTLNTFLSTLLVKNPTNRVTANQALLLPYLCSDLQLKKGQASLRSFIQRVCEAKRLGQMPKKPRRRAVRQGNFSTQSLRGSHQSVAKETQDTRSNENDILLGNWDSTRRTNVSTFASGFGNSSFGNSSFGNTTLGSSRGGLGFKSNSSWSSLKSLSDSAKRRQSSGSNSSTRSGGSNNGGVVMMEGASNSSFDSNNPFVNGNELNRTIDHDAAVLLMTRSLDIVQETAEEEEEDTESKVDGNDTAMENLEKNDAVDIPLADKDEIPKDVVSSNVLMTDSNGTVVEEDLDASVSSAESVPSEISSSFSNSSSLMDSEEEEEMLWDEIVLKRVSMGCNNVGEMTRESLCSIEKRKEMEMEMNIDVSVEEEKDEDVLFMNELLKKYEINEDGMCLVSWL